MPLTDKRKSLRLLPSLKNKDGDGGGDEKNIDVLKNVSAKSVWSSLLSFGIIPMLVFLALIIAVYMNIKQVFDAHSSNSKLSDIYYNTQIFFGLSIVELVVVIVLAFLGVDLAFTSESYTKVVSVMKTKKAKGISTIILSLLSLALIIAIVVYASMLLEQISTSSHKNDLMASYIILLLLVIPLGIIAIMMIMAGIMVSISYSEKK